MMRKTIFSLFIALFCTSCTGMDIAMPSLSQKPAASNETASVTAKPALNNSANAFACPSVGIIEDLRSITLFDDNNAPAAKTIQGIAKIEDFSGTCAYENGVVAVDLDVMFTGSKGSAPRAVRIKETNIAFPYFVAFADANGKILNKEVFAVAMRFAANDDNIRQVEHLKPRIPMPDPSMGGRYQILVGFQLNRAQLSFNRGGQ